MNLEKIFKNTILLYFLSTVVFLVISFTLEKNFLGEELYLIDSEIDLFIIPALEESIFILIWFLVALIAFTINILSLYFLYYFKPIGKKLYIYSLIVLFILFIFDKGDVISGPLQLMDYFGSILEGIIICFLYFTPIKEKFN
jgi:hypothetical protein